jgi:RNA polymerase sigma factor (TIGR02999 family)
VNGGFGASTNSGVIHLYDSPKKRGEVHLLRYDRTLAVRIWQESNDIAMSDVTQILSAIEQGDPRAADQLFPLVYEALRKLAAAQLAHEAPGQTLQATALVHEAYLRLVETKAQRWNSVGHFFSAAAESMRRILVDRARKRGTLKHGKGHLRQPLVDDQIVVPEEGADLIALDEALTQLATRDAEAAELVKLRFFAGLTSAQAADALGISSRTADRVWTYARTFLLEAIQRSELKE